MGTVIFLGICLVLVVSVIVIMFFKRKQTREKNDFKTEQPSQPVIKPNGDYYE